MSQPTSDSAPAVARAVPAPRPAIAPIALLLIAAWACVFATFVILGLRS